MERNLLIADIGSSALKLVLFGEGGAIRAAVSRPIATRSGADGSQEQHPQDWWSALKAALAGLPRRDTIAALAFTGSMQNLIPLSPDGEPASAAVLYSDRRLAEAEVEALGRRLPADYAVRTGNRLDPAHTILKLMRIERFVPAGALAPATRFAFGAKDAVIFRLTGRLAVDPTTASTTGLMDIAARRWDDELVAIAGISRQSLPEIMAADAIVGEVMPGPARDLGIAAGIPVFNGAGDAAAATWGAFADSPGSAYAYLGTTGWVAATLSMAAAAPPRDIYVLADPLRHDNAVIISPFLTAGAAMEWACELTGTTIEVLLAEAVHEDEAPGAALFLPYLAGERSPFEDQRVRGALLGLDRTHRAGAIAYAVMEGIAFAIRHNLETAGLPPSPLTLIGGAARHPVQQRLLADVLKREIAIPDDSQEMTALGVLRMVGKRAGLALDETAIGDAAGRVAPRMQRAGRCDARYEVYLAASRFAREQAGRLT